MDPILLGKGITDDIPVTLQPKFGNRHGLVAGATGTGKRASRAWACPCSWPT